MNRRAAGWITFLATALLALAGAFGGGAAAVRAQTPDAFGIWFDSQAGADTLRTTGPQVVNAWLILRDGSTPFGICGWEAEVEAQIAGGALDLGWNVTAGVNVATPPRFQVGIPAAQHPATSPAMVLATGSFWVPGPDAVLRLFIHPYTPASLQDPPGSGNAVQAPVFAANWLESDLRAGAWASGHEALPVAVVNPPADPAPLLRRSAPTLAFGDLAAGAVRARRLEIANLGGGLLTGSVPEPDAAEFAIVDGGGEYALGPGEVRTVTLRYQPTAAGEHAGTLAVGAGVALTGRAFPPGGCRVEPAALEFGEVAWGTRRCLAVTLYNDGEVPLSGTLALTGPFVPEGAPEFVVPAGTSTQIGLCFAPASLGDWTGSATIGGCATVALHGTATEPPPACVLGQNTLNFGTCSAGDVLERSTVLRNGGGGVLTGEIGLPTAAVCAPFTLEAGAGPFALAHGDSLLLTVRYAPTGPGVHDCTLAIGTCAPIYLLAGVPECSLSTPSLDFLPVYAGESARLSVTITNSGGGTMSGMVGPVEPPFVLLSNPYYVLGPAQSVSMVIQFAPTAEGSWTRSLPLGTRCEPVALTGVGLPPAPPVCVLTPTSQVFADTPVGTARDATVVVGNTGRGTLTGTISVSGAGFAVTAGGGAFTLTTGQSRAVGVRFLPTAKGVYTGALETGTTACATVPLYGNSPDCAALPAVLDFGLVPRGTTADLTFTITNPGPGPLAGTVAEACVPFSVTTGAGAYTLEAGQSWPVTVRFAPTVEGVQTCAVSTGAFCGGVTCTGQGISASCWSAPTTLEFGDVPVGQAADRTFTMTNAGTIPLTGLLVADCDAFGIVGAPDYRLEPGEAKTVTVRFTPTAVGARVCGIGTGLVCGAVACRGTGTSGPALCAVSADTLNFGSVDVGQTRQLGFTISNPGGSTLAGEIAVADAAFQIVGGGGPFTLAPGASRDVLVNFAPSVAADHLATVGLGTACPGVVCAGRAVNGPVDVLGIYFDDDGVGSQAWTTDPFTPLTAYLVLLGGSEPWGVSGWECCVAIEGNALAPVWTLSPGALNVAAPPCFQVGLAQPLVWRPAQMLASVQFIVPTPYDQVLFHVRPYTNPSLPGVPVYAAGHDPGLLVPLTVPGAAEGLPTAAVNGWSPTPVLAATPVAACADGAVHLSWRYDPQTADACRVYRRADDGPATALAVSPRLDGRGGGSLIDASPPAAATLGYSYALLRDGVEIARSAEAVTICAAVVPTATCLHPVCPNPFNPRTTVRFDLARAGRARLAIFDLAGRRVRTLCDEDLPAGAHGRDWDGRDDAGQPQSSGTYYARLTAPEARLLRKMTLVR